MQVFNTLALIGPRTLPTKTSDLSQLDIANMLSLFVLESEEMADIAVDNELRTGTAIMAKELYAGPGYTIEFDWQKNLRLNRFQKNPVLLADHINSVDNVIGRVPKCTKTRNGLQTSLEFAPDDRSQALQSKWDAGFIKGLSISYSPDAVTYEEVKPKTKGGRYSYKMKVPGAEMTHLALVPVPRDPDSLKNAFTNCLSIMGANIDNSIFELGSLLDEEENTVEDNSVVSVETEVDNELAVSDEQMARFRAIFTR